MSAPGSRTWTSTSSWPRSRSGAIPSWPGGRLWWAATAIPGIGARTAQRLGALGIVTVADLARSDHEELARHVGPMIGPNLRVLGLGGHDTPVSAEPRVPRGRSREVTFERDLTDPAEVTDQVAAKALEVLARFETGRPIRLLGVRVVLDEQSWIPE